METARIEAGLSGLAAAATALRSQAPRIAEIAHRYAETLRGGGTLLFAGNGGSAADAQHVAAEYLVRLAGDRPGLAALALTTDTSVLTAAGNDLGFDQIFARQVETLGRPGDLLILHSISGRSANLLAAARAARARGVGVIAMVGPPGSPLEALADLTLCAGGAEGARVQELHLAVEHLIAAEVERAIRSAR
jgi:phosphoheptose isomerase